MKKAPFLAQGKGIISGLVILFLLAVACSLTAPIQEEKIFSFDKEDLSGVVQLWCAVLDSKEQITYYPMEKLGDRKYRVFLPKTDKVHRWFYPSKKDFGEKVIRFDLTTAANTIFLMHLE